MLSRNSAFITFLIIIHLLFGHRAMASNTPEQAKKLLTDVTQIYMSSMTFIFLNQATVNYTSPDKKQLFGEYFINNVKTTFKNKHNKAFPDTRHKLTKALLQAMVEVMEDNKPLIMDPDIKFKGIIPATFASQLAAKLKTKGIGIKLKFTRESNLLRNQLNAPDDWELTTMRKIMKTPITFFDAGSLVDKKPVYRLMTPLPMKGYCLGCHGTIENNLVNQGKAKQEWSTIDMTGFEIENWTINDFGGAVSLSVDKSILN